MSDTIRIRTTPNGSDKYLQVKIEQDFDFIEVLSLNISQQNAYQNFCADYGVVVGRVVINSGFGVPNVKVSIFIPLDTNDSQDPHISGLYPYTTVTDKNSEGIRYNLLPRNSDSQDPCYTPVGTFPTKREVLDNEDMLYVYKKYYQFTTTTNYAGDFMLFGVPVGNHTVHVDMDISNIGIASQRPYDLIAQGAPPAMFYSPTKFKANTNLNSLPQIKTANASVNVQPFWGDTDNCQIGINRLDFDMNYSITPSAIFMGSVFGDHEKNSVDKRCIPRKKMGIMCEQETGAGMVEMIRKTPDNQIEQFDVEGGQVIDNNGAWAYQIPMNLDYMVTAEDGSLIPSSDPNIGIPTRTRVRFRVSMDESGGLGRLRTRAKYLVPNNPATYNDLDLNFDDTTKDSSFTDLYWNKIYTVRNYIPKYRRGNNILSSKFKFVGLKDVDKCDSATSFPYNNAILDGSTFNQILFTILCLLNTFIGTIASIYNGFLTWLRNTIKFNIRVFGDCILCWSPFDFVCDYEITLYCNIDGDSKKFTPNGCGNNGADTSLNHFINCTSASLATNFEVYQLTFHDNWINGTLYNYLLKYKRKHNNTAKYCDADCDKTINPCVDGEINYFTTANDGHSESTPHSQSINEGLIIRYNNTLYYNPITHYRNGSKKVFATDITNLGAIYDCDWQQFPKIINYLSPTTFKLPPIVGEVDDINSVTYNVSGMFRLSSDGLFFKANCDGVDFQNGNSGFNIKRLCELGVDIPETTGTTITKVDINQIYDTTDSNETLNSVQKYIRDSFTLLNISGSSISEFPSNLMSGLLNPDSGTSFGVKDENNFYNGSLYYQLTNYNNVFGNSYYMYFGLNQGKTAYDKLKSKYFTECVPSINDNFIINVNINPSSTLTASDGAMEIKFIGGVGPFTATIEATNFATKTLTTTNTPLNITGLTDGTYTIVAVDSLGTVVIREVVVSGPQRLSAFINVVSNPVTDKSNEGSISFYYLSGGKSPYTATTKNITKNTTFGPYVKNQGDTISNLTSGDYELTVIDSSTPKQTSKSTFTLTPPPPLTVSLTSLDSDPTSCIGTGSIGLIVNGGTPPYTISATSNNGYINGGIYGNVTLSKLFSGDYTVKVKDMNGTIVTEKVTIKGSLKMEFIGNFKTEVIPGKPPTKIEYLSMYNLISGGTPVSQIKLYNKGNLYLDVYNFKPEPTNISGAQDLGLYPQKGWLKKDIPLTGLTITATDKNGCSITKTFK